MSDAVGKTTPAPCPFCGGPPAMGNNEDKEWHANIWWVECDTCDARGPSQFDGEHRGGWGGPKTRTSDECEAAAVAAWNRRVGG